MRALRRAGGWALLCLALSGCGSLPAARAPAPLLRLSPASLGRPLALQQQLTVQARGRAQQLDVLLEADADSVRLAVLSFGQVAARLEWDGRQLQESRAPGWPDAVRAERILGDLQLMYWPLDAIRTALPAGWTVDGTAAERTLRWQGQPVAEVRYVDGGTMDLVNLEDGYSLHVASRPWGAPP